MTAALAAQVLWLQGQDIPDADIALLLGIPVATVRRIAAKAAGISVAAVRQADQAPPGRNRVLVKKGIVP